MVETMNTALLRLPAQRDPQIYRPGQSGAGLLVPHHWRTGFFHARSD